MGILTIRDRRCVLRTNRVPPVAAHTFNLPSHSIGRMLSLDEAYNRMFGQRALKRAWRFP